MTDSPELSVFQQKLAEHRAKKAAEAAASSAGERRKLDELITSDPELLPEIGGDSGVEISNAAQQVNEACDAIDIFKVYDALVGKWREQPNGRTESIMAICPAHDEKNPSAWFGVNDRGEWNLSDGHDVGTGWDKYSLAGMVWGIDHRTGLFEIKKRLANDLMGINYDDLREEEEQEKRKKSAKTTLKVSPSEPPLPSPEHYPHLNIWNVLPGGADFLSTFCKEASDGSSPDEFNLFSGMAALASTLNRKVVLAGSRQTFGNIALCLTGDTSSGKSTALERALSLVRDVMPYDHDIGAGTQIIRDTGSGEMLIAHHVVYLKDKDGKPTNFAVPTNSIIRYNEMSKFIQKSRSMGSTLEPVTFSFLDTETIVATSSRTGGTWEAKESFAQFVTTTQPGLLRRMFTKMDGLSGMLNRIWFPFGNRIEREMFGDKIELSLDGSRLALTNQRDWVDLLVSPGKFVIELEDEARYRLNDWWRKEMSPRQAADTTGLLGRIDLHCKRLALLMTVNSLDQRVTVAHAERAIAVTEYLIKCYAQVDQSLGSTEKNEQAELVVTKISEFAAKKDKLPTRRELWNLVKNHFNAPGDLTQLLKHMEELGLIETETRRGERGPATVSYKVTA